MMLAQRVRERGGLLEVPAQLRLNELIKNEAIARKILADMC